MTAVSGSGPAYVFLLAECLAQAGVAAGLPAALAERLARDTVAGAGALLQLAPEPAAELRRNVTSPGGTTAAALAVLMAEDGLLAVADEGGSGGCGALAAARGLGHGPAIRRSGRGPRQAAVQQLAELGQRLRFELADAVLGQPELAADGAEGGACLG